MNIVHNQHCEIKSKRRQWSTVMKTGQVAINSSVIIEHLDLPYYYYNNALMLSIPRFYYVEVVYL